MCHQCNLSISYIDYKKAYDSISHSFPIKQEAEEKINQPACIAFLPDRIIFIWSTKEFSNTKDRRSFRINVDYDHAVRVRWSPDGRALVAYKYNEGCIEVYRVDKVEGWFQNPTKGITFPRAYMDDIVGYGIAPDGKYLMTCSNRTELTIWDVRGNVLEKIDTFLMNTYGAKISPCGKFIAACGFASDVPIWEVKFSKSDEFQGVQKAFDLTGHKSGVYDVAFDQDTSKTVTVCKDGTWRIFNTKIEYNKGEMPRCLVTGAYDTTSAAALVALSPPGEIVAISTGKSIHFFSAISGKLEGSIENLCSEQITSIQFDSMGKYLLVCADRYVRVFHNIPGYKVALEIAQQKLKQPKITAATRERILMQIAENDAFLKKFE
ncbi:transducin beta-like protein 2 [Topomyia yanbarensis]|uniref:transducin beta-like protein 2 n=1 Tax=Topomyia yanbarensis TaxID=2498891 RepID=UPI00273AB0BB|nr:transducin beta-like protein 2 [Topomyia yanbarensis]